MSDEPFILPLNKSRVWILHKLWLCFLLLTSLGKVSDNSLPIALSYKLTILDSLLNLLYQDAFAWLFQYERIRKYTFKQMLGGRAHVQSLLPRLFCMLWLAQYRMMNIANRNSYLKVSTDSSHCNQWVLSVLCPSSHCFKTIFHFILKLMTHSWRLSVVVWVSLLS